MLAVVIFFFFILTGVYPIISSPTYVLLLYVNNLALSFFNDGAVPGCPRNNQKQQSQPPRSIGSFAICFLTLVLKMKNTGVQGRRGPIRVRWSRRRRGRPSQVMAQDPALALRRRVCTTVVQKLLLFCPAVYAHTGIYI